MRQEFKRLVLRNVTLGSGKDQTYIDNLEFRSNEVYWVRGGSGIERSSLLRILAGLSAVAGAQYMLDGSDVSEMSYEEFLPYRMNIGYSFSFGGLISNRTLRENLLLPISYHRHMTPAQSDVFLDRVLSFFQVRDFENQRPAMAPGAVRKLFCVLRAFMLSPQMLILDDPIPGLSFNHQECLQSYIHEYMNGKESSLIVSSDKYIGPKRDGTQLVFKDGTLQTLPFFFNETISSARVEP